MRHLVSRAIVLFLITVVVLLITGAFAGAALEFWFGPSPGDWGKDVVQTVRFVYQPTQSADIPHVIQG